MILLFRLCRVLNLSKGRLTRQPPNAYSLWLRYRLLRNRARTGWPVEEWLN